MKSILGKTVTLLNLVNMSSAVDSECHYSSIASLSVVERSARSWIGPLAFLIATIGPAHRSIGLEVKRRLDAGTASKSRLEDIGEVVLSLEIVLSRITS